MSSRTGALSRERLLAIIIIILIALLLVRYCRRQPVGPGSVAESGGSGILNDYSLECPNHDHPMALSGVARAEDTTEVIRLAGKTTRIPEFHDCQRLLTSSGHQYGPLVGIWVASNLRERFTRLLVAANSGSASGAVAAAVAVVRAWDGAYRPLGIQKGWNCLYIYPAAAASRLEAKMSPVGNEDACYEPADPGTLPGKTLSVRRYAGDAVAAGLGPTDYPAVGRIDWDPVHKEQFLGLGCGDGWCEVSGTRNYQTSQRYQVGTGASTGLRRAFAVKGWYDEQYLAHMNPAGIPVPADFMGTAVPDPDLGKWQSTGDFRKRWVRAAMVALEKPSAEYQAKMNLRPAQVGGNDPGKTMNLVELCFGSRDECAVPTLPASCIQGGQWWARITPPPASAGAAVEYRCVIRKDHSGLGVEIPATARWSWVKNDEKLWLRCAAGCCTLQ